MSRSRREPPQSQRKAELPLLTGGGRSQHSFFLPPEAPLFSLPVHASLCFFLWSFPVSSPFPALTIFRTDPWKQATSGTWFFIRSQGRGQSVLRGFPRSPWIWAAWLAPVLFQGAQLCLVAKQTESPGVTEHRAGDLPEPPAQPPCLNQETASRSHEMPGSKPHGGIGDAKGS